MGRTQNSKKPVSANVGSRRKSEYVHGSAAKELDVRIAIHEKPVKRVSESTRKNREKARHMSLGYVLFLSIALVLTGVVLIGYLTLQAENTTSLKNIASLESKLNDMRLDNEEEYSNIVSAVDMEEIKRVAIEELNMQYASEGQIVKVENALDDYVRQYSEMPK